MVCTERRRTSAFAALLSLSLLTAPVASGCDDDDDAQQQTEDGQADDLSDEFDEYQLRAKASEADGIISVAADGAKRYMEGDQLWSTPQGTDPWHIADEDDSSERPGMPIGYQDKTFPGGPNITLETADEIPEGGETVEAEPFIEGHVDFDADAVLSQLMLDVNQPMYFRYTYETGPGTGAEATATITAEANFNPDTSEHHTVTAELEVTDDGSIATEQSVKNELQ